MIQHTFRHMPGMGARSEEQLWQDGVTKWSELERHKCGLIPPGRLELLLSCAEASQDNLRAGNARYFDKRLPSSLHWRFFPEFRERTLFLDIETDGLDRTIGSITTIATYDGEIVRTYVQGDNLDRFPEDVLASSVLVTYNGRSFDGPYIERYFGIRLEQAHIDLRYVLSSLGYKGGLKRCEKALGIARGDVEGLDGAWAPILWRDYCDRGNERALETLLAYNVEDAINLELLLVMAYNMNLESTPFADTHRISMPTSPDVGFSVDQGTVARLEREVLAWEFAAPRGWT